MAIKRKTSKVKNKVTKTKSKVSKAKIRASNRKINASKLRRNSSKTSKNKKLPHHLKNTVRVHGRLHDIVHVHDRKGKKHKVLKPLSVEFHVRDALQVILGAAVLAVPVGFTQEVWEMGAKLSNLNILVLFLISLLFISSFIYYSFYIRKLETHLGMFFLRLGSTYLLSVMVVGIILCIIGQVTFETGWLISLKRIVLVAFPASMSGTVSDSLR
ncbi:DUF2391 family protein [archaeon]|jgi:uncharacterized membrane protein|nr:DUF2391 family protein [archaeon]MBT6762180.1 DUF2391 family protein [archaeon]